MEASDYRETAKFATVCMYNVLFTNDIVIGCAADAIGAIRKIPGLYRHGMKKHLNLAEKARKGYERLLHRKLREKAEFMAEANEAFMESVGYYVDVLHYQIKSVIDSYWLEHADALARLELAVCLCKGAVSQVDEREAQLCRANRIYRHSIQHLKQTELCHHLTAAIGCVPLPCQIDFNRFKGCTDAMEILQRKLSDVQIIADAIERAEEADKEKELIEN